MADHDCEGVGAPARRHRGYGSGSQEPRGHGAGSHESRGDDAGAPATRGRARPLGGVDRRFQPGRTSWATSGGGWSISVRIDNPAPAVGEAVRFDFVISSTVDPCCGVSAHFHRRAGLQRTVRSVPAREPLQPGSARFSTAVAFDRPGWQTFNVAATTGSCGLDAPRASLIGDVATVTAVSTACDGVSMPQSSSRSFTWSTESGFVRIG